MIIRTIRDIYNSEIDQVLIDEPQAFERAREFLKIVLPRHANRIKLYEGKEPLFHKYNIEDEIARIQRRNVPLKGGGSIVIDQTEALVAIDVNSGNFRADNNAEETAYQVNLRAAFRDLPPNPPTPRSGRSDRERLYRHAGRAAIAAAWNAPYPRRHTARDRARTESAPHQPLRA